MKQKVTILGLGYVGFPLAQLVAQQGHQVIGIDSDKSKITLIEQGRDPVTKERLEEKIQVYVDNPEAIANSDVAIVCVPTPVSETKMPDLGPVKNAVTYVADNISDKKPLVIVESTINPGVMQEVVKPIFDNKGYVVGKDYFLAHCPERINPGDPKWHVGNIPRVVGAFTDEGLERAYSFYTAILDAPVRKMKGIKEAEAAKILENSFRDINIAFINEIAKSFDKLGIDIMDVIAGASTKPFAFMAHYPGCGVGGHCIPVDPYYLIEKAKEEGFDHRFLRNARAINNSMPDYTVTLLQDALNEHEQSIKGSVIGLLGLSYKANVGDLRESPALEIKTLLEAKGANVLVYDPYLPSDASNVMDLQEKTDVFLLATNHDEYEQLDLTKARILVDGRNMFYGVPKPETLTYIGIGTKK